MKPRRIILSHQRKKFSIMENKVNAAVVIATEENDSK